MRHSMRATSALATKVLLRIVILLRKFYAALT
jgi:hypothetical protein